MGLFNRSLLETLYKRFTWIPVTAKEHPQNVYQKKIIKF